MAIKKSDLYSSLWQSCDELRGGMDASQYKDYVLVLLFVKYVSDKYGQKDSVLEVPSGASFTDMVLLKNKKDIGEKINKIISKLAEANDLRTIIDVADFDDTTKLGSGQAQVDRLTKLIGIFQDLDFKGNRSDGDDLLGDAYEYLMRHFATESGKSKGQFYTPAEVSRIMAKVIGVVEATSSTQTLYDPTCGSGSLLLKAHDEAKNVSGIDISIYGQEKDVTTRAMAKMNMILHNCPSADIRREDTLSSPQFLQDNRLKTFDFVVANPPFSTKSWSHGIDPVHDEYQRFEYGIPPKKNGDYAFLLHMLASLKAKGKGAIILPHGVLFRGNAEEDIRKQLIERGFIKGIIGLPPNLFYGTSIPACIIIVDKEKAAQRKHIFIIDASKGFIKDGNKNRLREQDIHKIVDTFNNQIELPKYSRLVSIEEIKNNSCNLNIPRYIDSVEPEDMQDIEAHLRGGIPNRDVEELAKYWNTFSSLRDVLFEPADRPNYCKLNVSVVEIKSTIVEHPQYRAFVKSINELFSTWKKANSAILYSIKIGDHPRYLINAISENLLDIFKQAELLDAYDVYQQLMSYWQDTMQDDVYMIILDGWFAANKPQAINENKDKKNKGKADFTVGKQKFKADLIPPSLIISKFFTNEQEKINKLESEAALITQALEEIKEENTGDEGLLSEVVNGDKISKKSISVRLKEVKNDRDFDDERKILNDCLKLLEQESDANSKVKQAQQDLEAKVAAQYSKLTEKEIKSIIIEDKWFASLDAAIHSELDTVSQLLSERIKQLIERYSMPLPSITKEVEELAAKVDEHLTKMGFDWRAVVGQKAR